MAISEDKNWKQNYTYGALGERISMSYLPSGDASNAWEPTPGASGANSGNIPVLIAILGKALVNYAIERLEEK